MSQARKLTGLFLVLAFIIGVPLGYRALCWVIDRVLALPPLSAALLNVYPFLTAFSVVVGLFWIFWAYSYLHFVGLGSPVEAFQVALHPTQQLVTTGPYAYSRNPMFLGVLFLLLAVALYGRSVTGLALLPIILLIGLEYIRAYEEPALRKRFGDEYRQYRRSVPALIPRFKR